MTKITKTIWTRTMLLFLLIFFKNDIYFTYNYYPVTDSIQLHWNSVLQCGRVHMSKPLPLPLSKDTANLLGKQSLTDYNTLMTIRQGASWMVSYKETLIKRGCSCMVIISKTAMAEELKWLYLILGSYRLPRSG